MADPVSMASAVIGLVTFAFDTSHRLNTSLKGYRSHNKAVENILDEIATLIQLLGTSGETLSLVDDVSFLTTLDVPPRRYGDACRGFSDDLAKCCSRTSKSRTSFSDWGRLRYMGEVVNGFQQPIVSYKSTINITTTNATLQIFSATAKSPNGYETLTKKATGNHQNCLEKTEGKLEVVTERTVTAADSDAS